MSWWRNFVHVLLLFLCIISIATIAVAILQQLGIVKSKLSIKLIYNLFIYEMLLFLSLCFVQTYLTYQLKKTGLKISYFPTILIYVFWMAYPITIFILTYITHFFRSVKVDGRPLRKGRKIIFSRITSSNNLRYDSEWLKTAQEEHSAIGSFAKLSLELQQMGAPLSLVRRSLQAGIEEIDHTEIALSMAGVENPIFEDTKSLSKLKKMLFILENLKDGKQNESQNALDLTYRAQKEMIPERKNILNKMAKEEQSHAELAEEILSWMKYKEPKLSNFVAKIDRVFNRS